jgi:ketosteroid isomerase-like protein
MSEATEFVRSLYDAFAVGDVPGFLAKLDARVVWNEAEGFPYSDANPYIGPEAIVAGVFARLGRDWSDFHVQVGEIVGGPDVVTMFGRYRGRSLKSGRPLDVQCAHTWWLRGGKVVRFQQMVDTARVAANLA